MRSPCPYPDTAKRECQIIRDHYQLFNRSTRLAQQTAHRFASQIHVRLRLGQFHYPSAYLGPPDQRPAFVTLDLCLGVLRKAVNQHKTKIVPRLFVFSARITEPNDQPIVSKQVQGILFFLASAIAGWGLFANHLRLGSGLKLRLEFDFLDRDYRSDESIGCFFNFDALANL